MPAPLPTTLAFSPADWVVVAAYFALLVLTGVWLSRRQRGTEDYFLGGRRMPAWAVAVSVLATALSAATFIGAPEQAYAANLAYLSASLGQILAALVVAFVFLPVFYRTGVTTVYELLQTRFGQEARLAGSALFMLGRVMASGARIYIAAHALSYVIWQDIDDPGHLLVGIAMLSATGVLYTVAGGIATVIWTDVVQTVVFVGAVLIAAVVLALSLPVTTPEFFRTLSGADAGSKLTLIDLTLDPGVNFTLWTALTGWVLLNLGAYGADQDLAQRLLTCRSAARASWSLISSALIGIPVTLLFMVIGLMLFVRDRHAGQEAAHTAEPFLHYITTGLPPGVGGLLVAGIFAAGLSSLDSALNAMSSTFVNDFYKRLRPGLAERHYLRVARGGVVGWGLALCAFASLCVFWQRAQDETLIGFALGVMTFAYAGLVGVFLCALLTRRGTNTSAVSALAAGLLAMLAMEAATHVPGLGFDWASPWRLVLATTLSFAVCASVPGRRRATS